MTKPDYQEYLKSERWATLKKIARERAGNRCQVCNSKAALQCHHRSYDRLREDGEIDDLIVICRSCHERYHGKAPRSSRVFVSISYREWSDIVRAKNVHYRNGIVSNVVIDRGIREQYRRMGVPSDVFMSDTDEFTEEEEVEHARARGYRQLAEEENG